MGMLFSKNTKAPLTTDSMSSSSYSNTVVIMDVIRRTPCHPWWRFILIVIILSLETQLISSAPDFTKHLHSILRNHTAFACENHILSIVCPPRTSVSVLSAFYGRHEVIPNLCPSVPNNTVEENIHCTSAVAIEKVKSECQDRQSCHVSVLSLFLGGDPCPLTTKFLQVSYKCQPQHHRTRLVCENGRLKLLCKNSTVLAIYSATFGHMLHGSPSCPPEAGSHSDMECMSSTALRKVSRRCHGKENCSLVADVMTFGNPCFPGTRKHLRVSFACVPRYLLEDVGFVSRDPFMIPDYTHDFPEKVVLYFVSGICAGLVFLLCIFGLRSMATLLTDVTQIVCNFNAELCNKKNSLEELSDNSSSCHLWTHDIHSSSIVTLSQPEV